MVDPNLANDTEQDVPTQYPSQKVVIPAMAAIALASFLVALDRTILGTAIPSITNDFGSFEDIAWYESAFLLPLCMLQLSFGRLYTFYSAKWILVILVLVFTIGSTVCAAAPDSKALIVGRAIQGIGAAGITSGSFILVNTLVPVKSRPKYTGIFGAVFGIASIVGPLLGGYLTAVNWRICFWINLPIGGFSIVVLTLLIPPRAPVAKPAESAWAKFIQLDPAGFLSIASSMICLLFGLQWGGTRYDWSNARIIVLFTLSGVFLILFVGVQALRKDDATIPASILLQRNMLAASVVSLGFGSLLVIFGYFLPLWFQAIQGKSTQSSGLSLLPLLLSCTICVIVTGLLTSVIGYYAPFMIVGSLVAIAGSALISTWQVDTSVGQWIGYQIVTGIGFGMVLIGPNTVAQTILRKDQAPIGLSILAFIQFLGGSIFVTVCQNLLQARLTAGLKTQVPDLATQGATSVRTLVSPEDLPRVLDIYNEGLQRIWYMGLSLAVLTLIGSLGVQWKNVKTAEKAAFVVNEKEREPVAEG